ncbi:MAG: RIP metalloprotease RseP, partial [Mesosutterella sp.]|nr:RIP metalloprotease RseP [Mesosutterella sp.]
GGNALVSLLITLVAFSVALELLVVVHEGGHFAAARLCGVRVLRFSVGFGPVLFKLTGRRSGTEYALSLLPLGGYVKMLDSRDPSMREQSEQHPQEDFNRKRLWQRALIVFAGPFMNLVLAVLIFWGIGMAGTYELSSRIAQPAEGTPAAAAGLRGGQYVTEVGGLEVHSFEDLQMKVLRASGGPSTITVRDSGDEKGENATRYPIDLSSIGFEQDPAKSRPMEKVGLLPWQGPLTVVEVLPGSAAQSAGFAAKDRILAVNGEPMGGALDFMKAVSALGGRQADIRIERAGAEQTIRLEVPEATDSKTGQKVGRIGVRISGLPDVVRVQLGPLEAFTTGVSKLWDTTVLSMQVMGRMLIGQASVKNLSGPVAIADYAGQAMQVGLLPYLTFLAVMSVSLGILNLLPVPVLDGGYLAIYAVELVIRRRPSERVIGAAQRIGLVLILLLTLIALTNDLTRLMGG